MPLYEYKCESCGDTFEVIQKFSDEPLTSHANCGGKVHRLLSAPAFQFKGTGWYVTDYARKNGSSGGNGKSGEKTEKKADSAKPASDTSSAAAGDTKK